jgi:hypothetical protein
MTKQKFEQFEIASLPDFPAVTLNKVKDFIRLVELLEYMHVFVVSETRDEQTETKFVLLHNEVMYLINAHGFKTLDEFEDAEEKGFTNAGDYYDAKRGGYLNNKDYAESKQIGVIDRGLHMKAQKLGFFDHYEEFKLKLETNKKTIPEDFNISEFDNALKLFQFATERGFKDYGDFAKAFFLGFTEQAIYEDARAKGFTYAKDFRDAVCMGFDSIREYQEATHLNIKTKIEYSCYDYLRKAAKNKYGFDAVLLIDALKVHENGKKLSVKKLLDIIEQEKNKCKFPRSDGSGKKLPEWFICKLNSDKEIIQFFKECRELDDFGIFDEDGEFFEVSRMSDTTIYVDGSNVAFSSMERHDNVKPHYVNIISLADRLREMRYKEIIVIADASLRNRVMDAHQLDVLKKRVKYLEAPAKTTADEFLIENAKKSKCYIISNDTFKDWKQTDKWIAENIDRIRIPFLRNSDGTFSLPVLEKLSPLN